MSVIKGSYYHNCVCYNYKFDTERDYPNRHKTSRTFTIYRKVGKKPFKKPKTIFKSADGVSIEFIFMSSNKSFEKLLTDKIESYIIKSRKSKLKKLSR
ncbi:hypothetical protein K9M42_03195 [Patescibacteria group bacterium]|nr:hypothetical protein [Patescibacteria group bacterium]